MSAAHATAPGSRLLSVEEARAAVLAAVPGPTEPEIAYLSEALGRVLAEPVISTTALPPWDNSAMDGYAIRAADVAAATEDAPVRLEVIGEVARGDGARCRGPSAGPRSGSRPARRSRPRADAVVPVELTTPLDADGAAGPRGRDATGPAAGRRASSTRRSRSAASIRRAGSDLARGGHDPRAPAGR